MIRQNGYPARKFQADCWTSDPGSVAWARRLRPSCHPQAMEPPSRPHVNPMLPGSPSGTWSPKRKPLWIAGATRTPSPTLEHEWRLASWCRQTAPSRSCCRHHSLRAFPKFCNALRAGRNTNRWLRCACTPDGRKPPVITFSRTARILPLLTIQKKQ